MRGIWKDDSYFTEKLKKSDADAAYYEALVEKVAADAVERLKDYLDNQWYGIHKECAWYGSHKTELYYGYWSFEAGAVVKILGLDDAALRDQKYYPYDLVHGR